MEPSSQIRLHLVEAATGEAVGAESCLHCHETDLANRALRSQLTRERNKNARLEGRDPAGKPIMEVLTYWHELCMPNARIVEGGERWVLVGKRLKEKCKRTGKQYTVRELQAAAVGAKLSDFHRRHGYLDATTIYRDSATVDRHIATATGFKRVTGTSALTIVDELGGEGMRWLAEVCVCGHTWLEHLRHGGPTPDGRQPCSADRPGEDACTCGDFDWFHARIDRAKREFDALEPAEQAERLEAAGIRARPKEEERG